MAHELAHEIIYITDVVKILELYVQKYNNNK